MIETELILSHIQLKKGSRYRKKTVQQDVKKLFSLGFFEDIQVHSSPSSKGLNISYHFKERMYINEIEFQGNDNITTDDLKELSLLKEYSFLNFKDLQETFSAIKDKYKEKGYYLADVSYKVEKLSDSKKLKLVIFIKENIKLFIKRVSFIGNRNISSDKLKPFLMTKEISLFSFLGGSSGTFNSDHIQRDRQFIEYYYRDKGYLNVVVSQPEITITPDKKFLYIVFPVSEGARFKVGQVVFQGDSIVPEKKGSEGDFNLQPGEYFSLSLLQKDMQSLSLLYKDKGYAFAEVHPQFFPDNSSADQVHILFKVNKGEAYKLGRVHLLGNKDMRDKVLFRHIRLQEGEIYNESRKELTQQLLQRLGYFEEVNLSLQPKATKGELDLFVNVKERKNTGEAIFAAGLDSFSGLFIRGGLKKQGFLGLNQSVDLNLNLNRHQEVIVFSYKSPYFLDSHWNFAFDVFNTGQDSLRDVHSSSFFASPDQLDYFSYFQLNTGFIISVGRHLTEFSNLFLRYKLEKQSLQDHSVYFLREIPLLSSVFDFLFGTVETTTVSDQVQENQADSDSDNQKPSKETAQAGAGARQVEGAKAPQQTQNAQENMDGEAVKTLPGKLPKILPVFNDIYNLEEGNGLNSSLSVTWEYDGRNDRYYASKGLWTRFSLEYSGLGGDFNYSKLDGKIRHYYQPFWKFVIKNRLDYGLVFSNDKDKPVPFTELFLLGGPYDLRGFPINSQGPRRFSQKALLYAVQNKIENPRFMAQRPYGGEQMFFYGLELEFPILENMELRGAFFFDIGEANDKLSLNFNEQLRADIGAGIRWKSPFGPISLDWALPYRPKKQFNEEDWEFHFSVGTTF